MWISNSLKEKDSDGGSTRRKGFRYDSTGGEVKVQKESNLVKQLH